MLRHVIYECGTNTQQHIKQYTNTQTVRDANLSKNSCDYCKSVDPTWFSQNKFWVIKDMSIFIESVDRSEAWHGICYLRSRNRLISPSLTLFEWFAGLALLARSVTEESSGRCRKSSAYT